jgi:serine/threonine protein kinase
MSDSEKPPVSGLVAGKYEVLRRIGRGGMGSVWEGRHASLGNRVAIKFIDQEYAESAEARSRFVTEARAAATIQSKHAIQIFDHGVTEDGRPYMVMELLTGDSLDKRLDQLGRLSLEETARILSQVCRALQRAHDAGIIHRDLKPENIFLVRAPDDDDETAKVLDFGIAKIKPSTGDELTSSTKTGAVLGTPYFMSPEQARGLRNLDYRSDLWSLGVIAYKCVTGVLPFDGESVGDLLVKICTSPLPVPSATAPGLPAAFDAWFARALEREPTLRFATATELGDSLLTVAGLSVRRGPASSQSRVEFAPASTQGTPPGAGAATPLPAGGLTSAGLEAAALPVRPSRGTLVAFIAAAVIGLVGVITLLKLVGPRTGSSPASSGAEITATATSTATATATATATPTPTATASLSPEPSEVPSVPAHAQRSPGPAPRPAATPSGPAGARPARPKPAAAAADPGY